MPFDYKGFQFTCDKETIWNSIMRSDPVRCIRGTSIPIIWEESNGIPERRFGICMKCGEQNFHGICDVCLTKYLDAMIMSKTT